MQLMDQIWTGLLNRTGQKLKTPNKLKSAEKSQFLHFLAKKSVDISRLMHLSSKPLPSVSGIRGGPILRIIGRRTGSFKR